MPLNHLPLIQIKNLEQRTKDKTLFKDFSFSPQPGKFVSILGPSGCGKSTLLKLIAGLEPPDKGEVIYPDDTRISFVFQDAALIPWLTTFENIKLALSSDKSLSKKEIIQKVTEVLALVKLSGYENYFPHELSGGMKMRVSIARALINEPQLLLMDEPFSALDELVRFELQEDLIHYWRMKKMTIFFVTHSINEAVFLSQSLLVFNKQCLEHQELHLPVERTNSLRSQPLYLNQVTELSQRMKNHA